MGYPPLLILNQYLDPFFLPGQTLEDNEDRSTKSSTAASALKLRCETITKDKIMNLSGTKLGTSIQRGGQGKARIAANKKPRGERVKIEQENSHSSMESDSRSSNFVFMQGYNSVTRNGRQSERTTNFDGEISADARGCEEQFNDVSLMGRGRNIVREFEDVSQENLAADLSWKVMEENIKNHSSSIDRDPIVESILALQSAQEALEKELEKFREIGKENILLLDESIQERILPLDIRSANAEAHPGESEQSSPICLKTEAISLKENMNLLERKLEEARAMLKLKEAKVVELEANLNCCKSPKEDTWCSAGMQQENYKEMETELESLFRQKIEAEVEHLAVSRTIQKLRVAAVDLMTLLEEPQTIALKQARMLNKVGDTEAKAVVLKKQAEELETYCEDIVVNDEVLVLQNMMWKYSSCFIVQLILLLIVLGLFVLQLLPHQAGVVPT